MQTYYSLYCNGEDQFEGSGGTYDRPNRPGFSQTGEALKDNKIRIFGTHNYEFDFRTQGESLY